MIKNIKWLVLVSLTFVACNNDDDATVAEVPVTAGSANFSKYVALGDSFAAGYSDGALFKKGQTFAYPNILAAQFSQAGGGAFTTPFCGDDNLGGLLFGGTPNAAFWTRLSIQGTYPNGKPIIAPVAGPPVTEVFNHVAGTFGNLGIPGAKSYHLLAPGYGNPGGLPASANPYFVRIASSTSTSVLADALTQQPTFFSLWIGGNDVLGYATSGGDGTNPITPASGVPGVGFDGTYNALIAQLATGGRKGVVANLPYINTLPFFTVIPMNPVDPFAYHVDGDENDLAPVISPADIATINQLNAQLYGPLKQVLTALGAGNRIELLSSTSANPVLLKDETLTDYSAQITAALTPVVGPATAAFMGATYGQARQSKKNPDNTTDYIILSTKSVIGSTAPGAPSPLNTYGITYPLQDKHVLIPSEINEIKVATDAYNVTIEAAATANGLAFVDAKAVMNQLLNGGIRYGNYHITAEYVKGGAFSLDGIHPTARGYALIANKFIEAINDKYGSTLRTVNLQSYPMTYPAVLP